MEQRLRHNTRAVSAVCVRKACKQYVNGGKPNIILSGLNMTIPKGCIYGLLGASGCGKTTLLSCILNRKKLDSGKILVFGEVPGSKGSGIPGSRVGYMPQELGLMTSFTIEESIRYFGWIAGVTKEMIVSRIHFLTTLLALPDKTRTISDLSGGQQRRTSLACTLIHEPELLVLDEPTVGLDSILRKKIWDHLIEISRKSTIIITTHYIEETMEADIVAFLREGCLLGEDSPHNMMLRFNVDTLEKVFLKLSIKQNSRYIQGFVDVELQDNLIVNDIGSHEMCGYIENSMDSFAQNFKTSNNLRKQRICALLWKHVTWMKRNPDSVFFFFFLSALQVVTFCVAIGHNPKDIKVGVLNYEVNHTNCNYSFTCNTTHLSCIYLQYLQENALNLIYYSSEEEIVKFINKGKMYAAIIIKANYSIGLRNRVKQWNFASSKDFEQSEIVIIWDTTNAAISNFIKIYLYNWFQLFVQNYLEKCSIKKKVLTLPVRIEQAVHGSTELHFTEFYIPGVIITLIFFMCISLTALYLIMDRKGGDMERVLIYGVTATEITLSYLVAQSVCMLGQVLLICGIAFTGFGMTQNGSLLLIINLGVLTGLCGMAYGLFIASICTKEFSAVSMSVGSIIPSLFISGTIWPTQCMSVELQWISSLIPLTKAIEALRCIMCKGWGLSHTNVYNGFIIMGAWIVFFLIITMLSLKLLNRT